MSADGLVGAWRSFVRQHDQPAGAEFAHDTVRCAPRFGEWADRVGT
jgi:hypothetical protein